MIMKQLTLPIIGTLILVVAAVFVAGSLRYAFVSWKQALDIGKPVFALEQLDASLLKVEDLFSR